MIYKKESLILLVNLFLFFIGMKIQAIELIRFFGSFGGVLEKRGVRPDRKSVV